MARSARRGQGALRVRRRGTRGGSHVGHLCFSARGGGERGAGSASGAGANPARIVPRGFNTRRWPRFASKLRCLLLREVLASKRCSSVERTVPSAVHSDLLLFLTRKCWLWHRFYLSWQLPFVYLAVLSLPLGSNTRAIWPVSPLKSRRCLSF